MNTPSLCLLGALLLGCTAPEEGPAPPPEVPEPPWPALQDLNPDPAIVEVALTAMEADLTILAGTMTRVWAYRDASSPDARPMVPGPMIEARAGDRVIVHFDNALPDPTTIHWHGVRLVASMDGTPLAQTEIGPGGTFDYDFVVPDAGLFWYHPHVDSEHQIERGLYAPLLVRGGPDVPVTRERVLVLDDIKIGSDGALIEETTQMDLMMGRQGNVLLVNGERLPELAVQTGARERWRLVNSANGTFFNLALPGGRRFLIIGWDGGALPQPYQVDTLLISPGERYDVVVELDGAPGTSAPVNNVHYDRGHDLPDPGPKPVFELLFGEPAEPLPALPDSWGTLEPIEVPSGSVPRQLVLTEEMNELDPRAEPEFFINGEKWPTVTPIDVPLGATELWEVKNDAEMDHPFHLHGVFFQVIERNGVLEAPVGNKDTVIVPKHSSLRFAVRFDAEGPWMYHCHILEHAERGMMGHVMVGAP